MAGRVRRIRTPAVTPSASANAAYPIGVMPKIPKRLGEKRSGFARPTGVHHQVTIRLSRPWTATVASPTTASLAVSHWSRGVALRPSQPERSRLQLSGDKGSTPEHVKEQGQNEGQRLNDYPQKLVVAIKGRQRSRAITAVGRAVRHRRVVDV